MNLNNRHTHCMDEEITLIKHWFCSLEGALHPQFFLNSGSDLWELLVHSSPWPYLNWWTETIYSLRGLWWSFPILKECPSADEWIRKLWYIYTMEYYSAIKKNTFNNPVYETAKETLMYRTVFWTLRERERVGWFGRMALNHSRLDFLMIISFRVPVLFDK